MPIEHSVDDRMKMYLYLGAAQYDAGDPESAIASYTHGKRTPAGENAFEEKFAV